MRRLRLNPEFVKKEYANAKRYRARPEVKKKIRKSNKKYYAATYKRDRKKILKKRREKWKQQWAMDLGFRIKERARQKKYLSTTKGRRQKRKSALKHYYKRQDYYKQYKKKWMQKPRTKKLNRDYTKQRYAANKQFNIKMRLRGSLKKEELDLFMMVLIGELGQTMEQDGHNLQIIPHLILCLRFGVCLGQQMLFQL